MSSTMSLLAGGSGAVRYVVEHRDGCVLIFGEVPMSAFDHLVALAPKKSVLHSRLRRMSGCTFAMGLFADAERLFDTLAPAVIAGARSRYAGAGLSADAINWLAVGEHGRSSMAMFRRFTGVRPEGLVADSFAAHPQDADDLGRCRLLLEAVPEFTARLQGMADVSPVWASIVANWAELCELMDGEVPRWREGICRAPVTSSRMQALAGESP